MKRSYNFALTYIVYLLLFQDKMRSKQKYRQKLISTKEKLEQEHYRRNQIERRKQQESQAKVQMFLFLN